MAASFGGPVPVNFEGMGLGVRTWYPAHVAGLLAANSTLGLEFAKSGSCSPGGACMMAPSLEIQGTWLAAVGLQAHQVASYPARATSFNAPEVYVCLYFLKVLSVPFS